MYKDTGPHLIKNAKEQPGEHENKNKNGGLIASKNNGSNAKSANESSVVEEEDRGRRKPWRRDLTSMTWSPVIL